MDFTLWVGYAGALLVGAVLGVLGGGGSILTIPLLVYLFRLAPIDATGSSMFIVGVASLAGVASSIRRGWLNFRVALAFVAPSLLAVYFTRHYVLPAVPKTFRIEGGSQASWLLILGLVLATACAFWFLGRVSWKRPALTRALVLAIPAALSVYVMRRVILPAIPEHLFALGGVTVSRDLALMLLLAIVMLVTGVTMLRRHGEPALQPSGSSTASDSLTVFAVVVLGFQGLAVGGLTGLIGAGGGFLITPALILLARLPVRHAVGTSLLIVAINSWTGFLGDLHRATPNWTLLLPLAGLALAGATVGSSFAARVPAKHLRLALGLLLTLMSLFIFAAELRR